MSLKPPQKAITSKLDSFTFKFGGNEITLRTSYDNLERLEVEMQMPFFDAVLKAEDLRHHAKVFHYLQHGTEHSVAEIYEAFFYSPMLLDDEEWSKQIEACSLYLLGIDKLEVLTSGDDSDDTKKKKALSVK